MLHLIGMCFFGLILTYLPHAAAAAEEDLEQKIRAILSQRHPQAQGSAQLWSELQAPPDQIVATAIQMAQRSGSAMEKSRLLEVIAHYDTPEAAEFLRDAARQTENSSVIRQIALRSLGTQLARQEDPKSLEVLEQHLESNDAQLKLSAAMGMERARANTSVQHRVAPLLEAFRKSKNTPAWVLKSLERSAASAPNETGVKTAWVRAPALVGTWDGWALTFLPGKAPQSKKSTFVIDADGGAKLTGAGAEGSVVFENAKWDHAQGYSWTGRWKAPCMARLRETTPPLIECVCPQSGFVFLGRK